MKNKEGKMKPTTAVVTIAVMVLLLAIVLGCTALTFRNRERMAELGYEETCYPGSSWTLWKRVPAEGARTSGSSGLDR